MTRAPAVLLISPGILRWTDQDFGLPHLVALGGYLRHHLGVRVEILDLQYEGGDHRALAARLDDLGPFLLVGLSCYSSFDYPRVMSLGRFLADLLPGVPLVTGGYHASAVPEDVVFDGSPFTAVIQGEAERPLTEIVRRLLGGQAIGERIWAQDQVDDLDTLPPYAWDLLDRYWPHATSLGRKLQVYLSRGCTYHCTFCMERSKSGYTWRAFSPERAVDELARLCTYTDLSQWVVNLADPLFGFQRKWRKEVLAGIVKAGIAPRQFWTLTRSDDLDEEDVAGFARAGFSIGIGLESGSPRMLRLMQKGNSPERYLDAIRRLASLSRVHGLNWATNVIVGHPGEDMASMRETHAFLTELFTSAPETCGWLSIDPFRLYPGAQVQQEMASWTRDHGTTFFHPRWWTSWYDGPFRAQHLDPSRTLDYATRVRFMHDAYAPLVAEIEARFRGQGTSVDRVFTRSLAEQRTQLSATQRDRMLALGRVAKPTSATASTVVLATPIGLQIKDPWVRRREQAVRRLLDAGVLRTESVIEALLAVGPERFLDADTAIAVLDDRPPRQVIEGVPGAWGVRDVALGLEALGAGTGERVVDAAATSGWIGALLAEQVGEAGRVTVRSPREVAARVAASLADRRNVEVVAVAGGGLLALPRAASADGWDAVWIGAALPRLPADLIAALAGEHARVVVAVGPRFRDQDLIVASPRGRGWTERTLARGRFGVLGGRSGWIPAPKVNDSAAQVRLVDAPGARRLFSVLAHLDLGDDAASLFDPTRATPRWETQLRADYAGAAGGLALHALPLRAPTVEALRAALTFPTPPLDDEAGRRLAAAVLRVLDDADGGAPLDTERWRALTPWLEGPVQRLRVHLWSTQGKPTPPLVLHHVPALGARARATTVDGTRVVATALDGPPARVAMQILHEEIHPITDPIVLARHPGVARDTRAGSEGWALHAQLEQTVIEATAALVDALEPTLAAPFRSWRAGIAEPVVG